MLLPTFFTTIFREKKAFHGKSPPFKRFCHRNTTNTGPFHWKNRIIIVQVCCINVSSSCALLPLLLKWSRPNIQETARKKCQDKSQFKAFLSISLRAEHDITSPSFHHALWVTPWFFHRSNLTSVQSPLLQHHPPTVTFWDVLPPISWSQAFHITLGATMAQALGKKLKEVWQFLCTRHFVTVFLSHPRFHGEEGPSMNEETPSCCKLGPWKPGAKHLFYLSPLYQGKKSFPPNLHPPKSFPILPSPRQSRHPRPWVIFHSSPLVKQQRIHLWATCLLFLLCLLQDHRGPTRWVLIRNTFHSFQRSRNRQWGWVKFRKLF